MRIASPENENCKPGKRELQARKKRAKGPRKPKEPKPAPRLGVDSYVCVQDADVPQGARVRVDELEIDGVEHLQSLSHLAQNRVLTVQVAEVVAAEGEEKLKEKKKGGKCFFVRCC